MPTWVGDACMSTPTLKAVRKSYPNSHLVGVMRPILSELLAGELSDGSSWFEEEVLFEKGKNSRGLPNRRGLAAVLARKKLDAILLLTNSFWTAAVVRLAGIGRRVGYQRDGRGILLTDRIPVPRNASGRPRPISAIDYYLEVARWIGCDVSDRTMQLPVSPRQVQLGQELWRSVGLSESRSTVVINSNAATDSLRIWPQEHVLELARRLANEHGVQTLLHCGPRERESANQIAERAEHPLIASMGILADLPIALSKAALAKADVVVTSDSGPRHIALAQNRAVVSMFGPTDVSWTETYNRPEQTLSENLACRPCYAKRCAVKHHRCMRDLSVQRVFSAVLSQMQGQSGRNHGFKSLHSEAAA